MLFFTVQKNKTKNKAVYFMVIIQMGEPCKKMFIDH